MAMGMGLSSVGENKPLQTNDLWGAGGMARNTTQPTPPLAPTPAPLGGMASPRSGVDLYNSATNRPWQTPNADTGGATPPAWTAGQRQRPPVVPLVPTPPAAAGSQPTAPAPTPPMAPIATQPDATTTGGIKSFNTYPRYNALGAAPRPANYQSPSATTAPVAPVAPAALGTGPYLVNPRFGAGGSQGAGSGESPSAAAALTWKDWSAWKPAKTHMPMSSLGMGPRPDPTVNPDGFVAWMEATTNGEYTPPPGYVPGSTPVPAPKRDPGAPVLVNGIWQYPEDVARGGYSADGGKTPHVGAPVYGGSALTSTVPTAGKTPQELFGARPNPAVNPTASAAWDARVRAAFPKARAVATGGTGGVAADKTPSLTPPTGKPGPTL